MLVPSRNVSNALPASRHADTMSRQPSSGNKDTVTDHPSDPARHAVTFGSFRLLPAQRLLLESGKPVRLGSRALDILAVLIERSGEIVTKEELQARVWPKTFVEDGNLRVHIASLRKVLGQGRYIANIPGRGYQFIAPVSLEDIEASKAAPAPVAPAPVRNIPAPLSRVVGRQDTVASLAADLSQRRFITLVGPGGIGKTTVALAFASTQLPSFRDDACFVDLTPITHPGSLPSTVASALGIVVPSHEPIPALVSHLRDKEMLLLLDSCEHVVEAAAVMAEHILEAAPGMRILVTSREPLRAKGEWVHRLPTLGVPPRPTSVTALEALAYPGVLLFVERATVNFDEFELTDANAPVVADICRRLDGIPLAIELAASHVSVFGIKELHTLISDRLALVMRGRRTALPRHRTLAATLDWSFALLSEPESLVLQRLSIFAGPFSLEAARKVAGSLGNDGDVIDVLANLVAKSLVRADIGGDEPQYSLLETTRVYAYEKLVESGELQEVARRHAEHLCTLFARAESERDDRPAAEWLAEYGREIDNLRRALDWAFSPVGDHALGVALSIAAVPLWMQMSLMSECRVSVERALAHFAGRADHNVDARMKLYAALSLSLMYTRAPSRDVDAAWTTTLSLAEQCGHADYQLRAIWGLFAGSINSASFVPALALAERFRGLARDENERLIGSRIMGVALHFLGDQAGAREHTERMIAQYVAPTHGAHMVRFQNDQLVAARRVLVPALWLQGYPEQAMRVTEAAVAEALAIDHALTLCNLLSQAACPVALLMSELETAERFIKLLLDTAERYALDILQAYGRAFQGILLLRRGEFDQGVARLQNATTELRRANFTQYYTPFLGALAYGLGLADDVAHGLSTIDEALARSELTSERWFLPELLRIKGKLVLLQGQPHCARVAEDHYRHAIEVAVSQGTLSWELRAAISLAHLLQRDRRVAEARNLLAPILGRFTEGLDTHDPAIARKLLTK